MIRFTSGNLLEARADALVNTVNEVGVMGKGIALMFRDAFPDNTRAYERAAKAGQIKVGHVFITANQELIGPRYIINFPTKKHWRQPSRIEWIRSGLADLVRVLPKYDIQSIAMPPLGCGNGGLDWEEVRPLIESFASRIPAIDVFSYEPTDRYQGKQKASGVERLTPARALIAELVRRYAVLGLDCTILEVQKLAWFLTREINRRGLSDPLKLEFRANRFGPYDDRLRHLLDSLDGSYLHSDKRLADASPYDLIRFDETHSGQLFLYLASEAMEAYLPALEAAASLIDGFESPLGVELLATVDWLLTRERVRPTIADLESALDRWPGGHEAGQRKRRLFSEGLLELALERLTHHQQQPVRRVGDLFDHA